MQKSESMRRKVYNKKVFLKALQNLGWKEITPDERLRNVLYHPVMKLESADREFTKGPFHLVLRIRRSGYYCLIHKNRVVLGHHVKPMTKGDQLQSVYSEIIEEYRRILAVKAD